MNDPLGLFESGGNDPLGLFSVEEQPVKRKTSIAEDIGIGLESAKDTILNAAGLIGGGIAGLVGNTSAQEETYGNIIGREEEAMQEAAGREQGMGGQVISGLAGIVPMLAGGAVAGGVKGAMYIPTIADTLSSGGRDIQQGATPGQAGSQAVVSGAANALANAVLPGLGVAKGALVGAGTNVTAQAATDVSGQAIMGDTQAARNYEMTPEKYAVSAATGAVPGALFGAMGAKSPKDLPKNQEVTPAAPVEYVQREIKDIQTRHESVTLDIANKQKIGENIVKSMSKVEQQIANLARLPDNEQKTKLVAKLQEQLQDKQTKVESIAKAVEELKPKQQMYAERLAKLGSEIAEPAMQKTEADATVPRATEAVTPKQEVPIEQRIARLEQVSERLNNPPPDFDAKEAAVVWKKTTEALAKETDEELRATLQIVQKQAEDMLANEELVTSKVNGNYIDTLDVDSELQGRGLGAMKVKSLEADMLRQKHKDVTVLAKPESVGFWEKQGYTKSPQADLSDNVLMTKRLGKSAEVIAPVEVQPIKTAEELFYRTKDADRLEPNVELRDNPVLAREQATELQGIVKALIELRPRLSDKQQGVLDDRISRLLAWFRKSTSGKHPFDDEFLPGERVDHKQGHANVGEVFIKTTDDIGRTRPLNDLITEGIQRAKSPWVKSVLTRMQNNPNLLRLKVALDDYTLIKNNAEAAYENSTGTVLTRTEITPLALAHEVMHGAANDVLIRYAAGEKLPVPDRIAAKYMVDSWDKFRNRPEFKEWKHAMSNVREFVAHLTDSRFATVLNSIDKVWYQKLYDKFVDIAGKHLGLTHSETRQFKDIMGISSYIIDTSLGMATPKSILEAVGIITKSDLMQSDPGSIRDIQSLSEPDDPLRLINQKIQRDLRGEETPISTGELVRAPVAGRHELAQSLKASPIVRHTNAVMKRADELFERGKRTILDGATAQKRKAFGILRNLTDTADERSYTTIYDKTNKGDLTDAAEVVLQAARDRVAVDSLDGFKRLSADKQLLVQALAQSYKRAHTFMNEQLTAIGAKPIPFKEGYIAHGRNGDFALNVHAKAATGEQVLAYHTRFYTKQERDAFIARVNKEHPELVIDLSKDTWSVKHAKKHEQDVNEARTLEMLAEANKLGGKVDPELMDKLRTMSLEGRFFGGHHMFQTAAEGFSGSQWFKTKQENARDLFRGPFHYADEVGRFARNAYIHRLLDPIIDNPDLMDQHRYLQSDPEIKAAQELSSRVLDPNYDSLVKDAMDSMAGEIVSGVHKVTKTQKSMAGYPDKSVFDRVNGVLATVFNIKTMMARPAFAAAQGMSWMSQVPQYLSLQYGDSVGNQSKLMVAGIARAMDMRQGTEWDAMIERAKTHHTFKPIAINDFTAIRKEFDNAKLNRIADKGTKLLTGIRMSELADTMSRYITYAILYEKGKQLGLSGDKLFHFMADGTDGAMGLFQKDTKAPVITQTGIFGDLVAPVSNYLIMQGNWLGTAVKRLAKNGELTPLTTVILANIMAGGAIAAPLMLEYEILRLGINSFLDEDDHLPSAVRKLHNFIGDTSGWVTANVGEAAGRVADATLRQGAVTGAMQAGAEALGFDRAPDIGAGLRYQALGKNLFDENKSFADSFSAWSSIASDVALIKDIILGKDNTEAGMRKGLAALRTTVVHDFLTNHYFLPWMQANSKAMHTVGKDSAALFERNAIDDLAQALGGRSTRLVNEATAKQFRLEDDRKKQQAVGKAMQGLLDLTIRQESGQTPPIMEGRMPMAIARMQALARKYPDMEPFLNTLGQRLNEEAVKKALPDIVRVIQNAKPHEMKQKLEEYLKITGQKVTYQ